MKIAHHVYGYPRAFWSPLHRRVRRIMYMTPTWVYSEKGLVAYGFEHDGQWGFVPEAGKPRHFRTKRKMHEFARRFFRNYRRQRDIRAEATSFSIRYQNAVESTQAEIVKRGLRDPRFRRAWREVRVPLIPNWYGEKFEEMCDNTEMYIWCGERDVNIRVLKYFGEPNGAFLETFVFDCPTPEIAFEVKMRWY